ncbi:hypothetical protein J437_LFUL018414 [Ladona fulva]|uniref:Uncharacterized protein n=1 Tax=Ladona fulva TaxID=123851 RepID=A0A8K0NYY3_LADFU|nr:hypothetical protein J437_LFUL018414 [Ladona fulva]
MHFKHKRELVAGIVGHLIQHDLPQSEICPLDLGNKDRQLRNSDLTTTYQAVGIGLIVAAIAFIVEQLINFWKKWKNGKSKNKLFRQKMRPAIINILSVYPWFNSKWAISQNISTEKKFKQSRNGESYNMNLRNTNIMCDEMEGRLSIYNGREYIRVGGDGRATRLIPIRTPSAVLFDKAYKEGNLNISKKSIQTFRLIPCCHLVNSSTLLFVDSRATKKHKQYRLVCRGEPFGHRKFYTLPEDYPHSDSEVLKTKSKKCEDSEKLIRYIEESVIGRDTTFSGPFGRRKGCQ